jgi:HK97 family phage major capsid protein
MSYEKDLLAKRQKLQDAMVAVSRTSDTREFNRLSNEFDAVETKIAQAKESRDDMRGDGKGYKVTDKRFKHNGKIEGRAYEGLDNRQSATEWYRKAQENNLHLTDDHGRNYSVREQGTDRDLNAYWGERISGALQGAGASGWAKPTLESRALGEDTGGSAVAITPQAWTPQFIDVLLPNTIMDKVGGTKVMMPTEYYNYPVYTSTVSPSWIAEAGAISLDGGPAFAPLQLIAIGGFKDITQYSVELAQDAYISGGLPQMLQGAIARKMSVALDTAMLLGVSGNAGIPGLVNESGFVTRHYTGDAGTTGKAPTDTTELGVAAEQTLKKNIAPNAFVSNVGVAEAFRRIPASTYGKFWEFPQIVSDMDYVTSENSALPYVETDPATATSVAQSGGAYGSLYCGPWNPYMVMGVHLDLQTRIITERYIDSGEFAIFSFLRVSIRFAHPETFTRTIGVIPV